MEQLTKTVIKKIGKGIAQVTGAGLAGVVITYTANLGRKNLTEGFTQIKKLSSVNKKAMKELTEDGKQTTHESVEEYILNEFKDEEVQNKVSWYLKAVNSSDKRLAKKRLKKAHIEINDENMASEIICIKAEVIKK